MKTPFFLLATAAVSAIVPLVNAAQAQTAVVPPSKPGTQTLLPARITEIAGYLPASPAEHTHPIGDRAFWDARAATRAYQDVVKRAEGLLKTPLPPQPDDLYLEYSRNGNRTRWQSVASSRRGRLTALTLAECADNRGRFVPALEEVIKAVCAEPTWVLPAHDAALNNFHGKVIDIDLGSSDLGWQLAYTDALVGEKLSPAVRQLLRANLQRRILDPYIALMDGKKPPLWWMVGDNNWNAVCHAGVVGVALLEVPDRALRARFVTAAEVYTRFFLSGFTPDGYCGEGLSYWNYGFGHYALLSETVRQATDGHVDLLASAGARKPAAFGARIQIQNGLSPAFADCPVFAKPSAPLMNLISQRLRLPTPGYETLDHPKILGSLYEEMLYPSADGPAPRPLMGTNGGGRRTNLTKILTPLRDYFDTTGILVARPGPQRSGVTGMGVALKGGSNGESHNHNDVGSYVVAVGDRPVLLDPGGETYTARTFSSHRYDSKLLNSYGHPVPVVAGELQRVGADARAKVLKADFSPEKDILSLDITSAYAVKALKNLTRTWVYTRGTAASLTVTDTVSMTAPATFGTAFLTLGTYKKQADNSLLVFDGDQAVKVVVDTGGKPYTVTSDLIKEDADVTPTRIGIDLNDPTQTATVTLTITPWSDPSTSATPGALLKNGGFESGAFGWELPASSMGTIATDHAATGTASLHLLDTDPNAGSNIVSSRMTIASEQTGKAFVVRGKVNVVSGKGIGLYVRFLDRDGALLNPTDAGTSNIAPVGQLTGVVGQWTPFSFGFTPPAGTVALQLWLHSFNGALVEAYLDDLEVVAP